MNTIKIPKGWRKLRGNEIVRIHDKFMDSFGNWNVTANYGSNFKVKESTINATYIRRKLRK
jgi:hypothetical protein